MPVSFEAYCATFKRTIGGITALLGFLVPLIAGFLPDKISRYLFPPLHISYHYVAVALAVGVSVIVYFLKDWLFVNSKRLRVYVLAGTFGVAVLGALSYLVASQRFVREIYKEDTGETVVVTVGYKRTELARHEFPQASDWDLLRYRGQRDEDISDVWTTQSIIVARFALFSSYLLFLLALVATGSLAALYEVHGDPTAP